MSKFDVAALTLNPLEASEVGKAVIERVFVQTDLTDIHDIETGIVMKEQIVFVDRLDVSGEALSGCTPAEQDGLAFSQKYWDPEIVAGRYTNCAKNLNNLFKLFKREQKINPDAFNKEGSQELGMLYTQIVESMKVSVFAKAWFGDKDAKIIGTGDGVFTVGTKLTLFNQIDGLWKQIIADSNVKRVTITENSGATYAAQVLGAGKALEYFRSMHKAADSRLLADPSVRIVASRSMVDNYNESLEEKQGNGGITTILESGNEVVTFRGIPVITANEFDRLTLKYQTSGTKTNLPNRAVLTTPSNVKIGTLATSDLDTLDSWYEKKDKSNIVDFAYNLDAKHGESYMTVAAY